MNFGESTAILKKISLQLQVPSRDCNLTLPANDKTVRIWNITTKSVMKEKVVDEMAKCISYSGNGKFLAVGLHNGMVFSLEISYTKE